MPSFERIKLVFLIILSYLSSKVKKLFEPVYDMRYFLSFNNQTKTVNDSTGCALFTLKLSNEFDIYFETENDLLAIKYKESETYPGYRFFYGLPIVLDQDFSLIFDSSIDGRKKFDIKSGEYINYEKIINSF